ncbi:MAG TPA: thioredoxin family protein [Ignavibacteriales bacterium]|nr:thioredoxin family protein [Ignavibacteriales bacterium]
MKNIKIILFAFVLFALYATGYAQEAKTEKVEKNASNIEKFDPKRDAAKDIENAVVEAKKSGKNILLDVGGEWCPWCRALSKLMAENKEIADYMKANYVVVKVNFSKENKNEAVLSKYPKIPGYPHLFVLDSEGKLLHSQDTGVLESGKGHDPEKVLNFLKEWSPKNVKKAS